MWWCAAPLGWGWCDATVRECGHGVVWGCGGAPFWWGWCGAVMRACCGGPPSGVGVVMLWWWGADMWWCGGVVVPRLAAW